MARFRRTLIAFCLLTATSLCAAAAEEVVVAQLDVSPAAFDLDGQSARQQLPVTGIHSSDTKGTKTRMV